MADRRVELVNRRALVTVAGGSLIAPLVATQVAAQTGPDREAIAADRAAIEAILATAGEVQGAGSVTFQPAGTGAVVRSTQAKLRDRVSVKDFGAVGDGLADDTAAIQAAINYGMSSGAAIYAPAGDYRLTSTLTITDDLIFHGDGPARTRFSIVSASVVPAIHVACPDNTSIVGLKLGNFSITCNDGAAVCDGVKVTTTATNSAVSVSDFHNFRILACRRGVWMEGIIYMSKFRNITVSVSVAEYGWYVTGSLEVIYNSFTNLEVTGVENGAYAYHSNAPASQWETITADGCCQFSGAYTTVNGISVEGIHAATPASTYCIETNQIKEMSNVAIINVPNAKCSVGLLVNDNISIFGLRFPDRGAGNQPNRPVFFQGGSTGIITSAQMENCANRLSRADLEGVLAVGCEDITDHSFFTTGGEWTPTFTGWSTDPTIISAQWERHGRMVFVTAFFTGGVSAAGDGIGGLPFVANSTQGAAAYGAGNSTTKVISGSIGPGASAISNIPALTLTGEFWQISATYLV